MSNWLPITKYSLKNGISISTIRRKIKNKTLEHKIENGKYFIMDDDADYEIEESGVAGKKSSMNIDDVIDFAQRSIDTADALNRELLEEKEKVIKIQDGLIIQLKDQINELKMLVGVLEKGQ
ncbi:MAG: hypothetical protein NTY22_01015 [Proteobacteria bacterium]|nr:hypothetical protein [Pseudomonadota bacterium]